MDKKTFLKELGALCQLARRDNNHTQLDVAKATGYSVETVSGFENGRNNNLNIFLWYVLMVDVDLLEELIGRYFDESK